MSKKFFVELIMSCLRRFPFWEALSLMMLFGEMEGKHSQKLGIPTQLVYLDVGLLVVLGTFMTFNTHGKRNCALISVFQMLIHSLLEFQFHKLNVHVLLHILLRNVGVMASYLLIASGVGDGKAKRSSIIQLSHFVFGLLFAAQAYLLASTELEQNILKSVLPSQVHSKMSLSLVVPLLVFCLATSSFCYVTQQKGLKQAKRFTAIYWMFVAVPSDLFALRWAHRIEMWTFFRLIASSLSTLGGIVVLNLL